MAKSLPEQEDIGPPAETILPLNDEELIELRWLLFGRCPICANYVKGWTPGPFHAERYKYWHEIGIDAVSGHRLECTEKWRKA